MANDSRFAVSEKAKIEEKYVMYVEDLHVSFKGNSMKKEIESKIRQLKEQIKRNKSIMTPERLSLLNNEIVELKDKLTDRKLKEEVASLKAEMKSLPKEDRVEYEQKIKTLEESMVKNNNGVKHVLKGVTIGLRQGETLALVGANGAGKTVFLETMLGFNIPTHYEKMILNLGHKNYSDNLQEVGIQYQQAKMATNYKVREAIHNQMKLYGKRIDRVIVEEMIEEFGIQEFINSSVEALSGGQKQRLNLLLAVMHQPKIMILDEFITGLDVNSVRKIISYVNKLKVKNNASMIIVSHQPEEIESLADRIVTMKNGVVTGQSDVYSILKKYGTMAAFVEEVI